MSLVTTHIDAQHPSHLAFLARLSEEFAVSLDIDQTLEKALQGVVEVLEGEAGALFLIDEADTQIVVCRAYVGPVDVRNVRVRIGEGIVGRCISRQAVEIVDDPYGDSQFLKTVDKESGFVTRSILCSPLMAGSKCVGAIEILNKNRGDGHFHPEDAHLLQVMASSAALAISNAHMAKALMAQERVKRELELAAKIQQDFLPRPRPASFPVHGHNKPVQEVSGDFFDIMEIDADTILFSLGDVTGKGINAALLMAKSVSVFRCLGKSILDPATLMTAINRELCETRVIGMFVTLLVGIYDRKQNIVRFASAGHEPPLLVNRDGEVESFSSDAPPVGIKANLTFKTREVALDGGAFYVFTDGFTEARNVVGTMLGQEGLIDMLSNVADLPGPERVAKLFTDLTTHGWRTQDDLTLLVVDGSIP